MSKYNDDVIFKTDKKDNTMLSFKKFLYLGLGSLVLIFIVVLVIILIANKRVDTRLSTLSIDEGIISPDFYGDVLKYQVETDLDSIYFTCSPMNKKVKVDGCGRTIKLENDKTNIMIVSSYKSFQTVYTFVVTKTGKFDVEISGNPETWTDQDVTLQINAESSEGVPLHQEAYSFDDGETFGKENTKIFTENGNVDIRVRDQDGNISGRRTVKISKIDKNTPSVKLSVKGKKLTAVVTPNKTPSGYKYEWYKNGERIKGSNKISYTAKEKGNYKVLVKSGIGKQAESDEVNLSTSGTTYTISYNANGGVDVPSDQIKAKDKALTISSKTPRREGYRFVGWAYSKDGAVALHGGDKYTDNKSCVLYAIWEAGSTDDSTFIVSYNGTGGTNIPSEQVKEKDKDLTLSAAKPVKANHEFLGWSTTNGGAVEYAPGAIYNQNQSIVLYAVWQKMKTITVSYNGNGASVKKGKTSANGTNSFTMPNITRKGYTILGWSTSPTATQAQYKVGQKVKINASTTLFAITKKNITATFDKNTADSISSTLEKCSLYNLGTLCSVNLPAITAKNNGVVIGWATSKDNSTNVFAPETKVAISKNTTFYAITSN